MQADLFRDRTDAGQRLAERLAPHANRDDVVVLGLPRGGVPLGVAVVRKLGVPGHEELAMGAIATGGVRVLNPGVVESLGIPAEWLEAVTVHQRQELARRERACRGPQAEPLDLRGKTVLLVDDGMATGATMRAAVRALRLQGPARLIVAVPVAAREACAELAAEADEAVALLKPRRFWGVGQWYEDFSQTSDEEVRALLLQARQTPADAGPTPQPP